MKKILALPLVFFVLMVGAVYPMSTPPLFEESSARYFSKEDEDFQKQFLTHRYYEGVGGLRNFYAKFEKPDNAIAEPLIVITGLEDITENWWDTVKEAFHRGFRRVYVLELRGQGHSEKTKENSNNSIYIQDFSHYTKDLISALQDIERQDGPLEAKPFVIAHSTGTLALAASLDEIQKESPQWRPQKISFWAPLIIPSVSPVLNNPLVKPFLWALDGIGEKMGRTVLGRKFVRRPFDENHVTTSKERYEWTEAVRYGQKQNSSGVSLRWALETFPVAEKILEENYPMITQPCLVFKADDELVVKNNWEISNPNFQVELVPGSRHALHIEKPEIFLPMATKTFDFFLKP